MDTEQGDQSDREGEGDGAAEGDGEGDGEGYDDGEGGFAFECFDESLSQSLSQASISEPQSPMPSPVPPAQEATTGLTAQPRMPLKPQDTNIASTVSTSKSKSELGRKRPRPSSEFPNLPT